MAQILYQTKTRYTETVYSCLWCGSRIEEIGNRTKPATKYCRHTLCSVNYRQYEQSIRNAIFMQKNIPEQVKLREEIFSNWNKMSKEEVLDYEINKVAQTMIDMGKPVEDVMAIFKKAIKRNKVK